jgi:hypothetical protein
MNQREGAFGSSSAEVNRALLLTMFAHLLRSGTDP